MSQNARRPGRGRGGRGRPPRGLTHRDPGEGSSRGGRREEQEQSYDYHGGRYGPPPTEDNYQPPRGRPYGPPPNTPLPYDDDYSSSSQNRARPDKGKKRAREPSRPRTPEYEESTRQKATAPAGRNDELQTRLVRARVETHVVNFLDLEDQATFLMATDLLDAIDASNAENERLRTKIKMLTERIFAPMPTSRRTPIRDEDHRMEELSQSRPRQETSSTRSRSSQFPPPRNPEDQHPVPRTVEPRPIRMSEPLNPVRHLEPERPVVEDHTMEPPVAVEQPVSAAESHLDVDTPMKEPSRWHYLEDTTPPGWTFGDPVMVHPPGDLLPEPGLTLDTRPEPPPPSGTKGWEMYGSDEDTDYGDTEDDEDRPKTAQQKKKAQNRSEQQKKENEDRRHRDPGRIPDVWGVFRTHSGATERNNQMRYMLSWKVHYSPRTNIVTTGGSAQLQSRADYNHTPAYDPRHAVYHAAPRGLPLNPREVDDLRRVVNSPSHPPGLRVEAHILLTELLTIAERTEPHCLDRAMRYIIDCGFANDGLPSGIPSTAEAWGKIGQPILRDTGRAITGRTDNATRGAGVPIPAQEEMLNVDVVGQWLMLHCRPGMPNFVTGTVMNYQFGVHRRSVFGYGLSRLLAPSLRTTRVAFIRRLAIVFASPGLYREAIQRYNEEHPMSQFQEQTGPIFAIRRAEFPVNSVGNLSVDDVVRALLFNRIPPAWIDHAYIYGLHQMAQSFTGSNLHEDLYRQHDEDRLRRLRELGAPLAIPEWDGWRYPTHDDYNRLLILTKDEWDRKQNTSFLDGRWLRVGESPFFTHLEDGPNRDRWLPPPGQDEQSHPPPSVPTAAEAPNEANIPVDGDARMEETEAMDERPDATAGDAPTESDQTPATVPAAEGSTA